MLLLSPLSPLWMLLHPAQAAPDRIAATFSEGTEISDVAQDDGGDWVAFVVDSEVRILNAHTWSTEGATQAVCVGNPTAVTFYEDDEGDLELFVGCDDGGVGVVALSSSSGNWSLSTSVSSSTGSTDTGDTGDTTSTDDARSYSFSTGVLGLATYNDTVYAVIENANSGGAPVVRSIDPTSTSVTAESTYAVVTTQGGFTDVALNALSGRLYVLHSGDNVSQVTLGSSALTGEDQSLGATCSDIAVYGGFVLMAGGSRGVLQFNSANDVQVVLNDTTNMGDVTALGAFGSATGLLVADAESSALLLYDMSTTNLSVGPSLLDSIPFSTSEPPFEMASLDGYILAATGSGEVLVVTERPWVTISTGASAYGTATTGQEVALTFSSDEAGDWKLRNGSASGEVLASGTIDAGGEDTAAFTVNDGLLSEGLNELWLTVTDSDGLVGHDVYEITVDTPPDQVALGSGAVSWGNGTILLEFDGVEDEDLDRYEIYVSLTSFSADDYATSGTGGPTFWGELDRIDGVEVLSVPYAVEEEPGATVVTTIEGVTNGYTYYVAVRAVDEGGLEGPMSKVVSVTPQETYSAAQLAGETGGFCGSPLPASLALAGLGGLLALGRRRRLLGAGAALLVVGGAALSAPDAHAEELQGGKQRPPLRAEGSSIQIGSTSFSDTGMASSYGDSGNLSLLLGRSVSLRHILELDAGVGLVRGTGSLLASDGLTASGEDVRLTILPVTVAGTLRLDLFENQPIVPYLSVGGDYWLWRESWATERKLLTDDALGGGKYGWHWSFGGQILLDIFDQEQASQLQARRGILDSYLTFEIRETTIGDWQRSDDKGLLLGGSVVALGLRFDR